MKYAIVRHDGTAEIRHDSSEEVPEGAVALTDEQYYQLVSGAFDLVGGEIIVRQIASPVRNVQAEIDDLERSQMMPRATREFMLTFMELNFTQQQLAGNIGYIKVKAFDDEIKALRTLL